MVVTGDMDQVRRIRNAHGWRSVGLVPTMGYLHEGHLNLVRRARSETEFVAVSIFVNPTQFGPTEDLSRYPRDEERDLALLGEEHVDLVFMPAPDTIYPPGFQTYVNVLNVSQPLEGSRRPTHFQGVATVVAKLFNIIQPTHAYFGQKDAQQTVVVRQMIRDLNFPVQFVVCPTTREADGLAMSSRNKYLDEQQRVAAGVLYRALSAAKARWKAGERNPEALRREMLGVLAAEPLARVDYVSAADPASMNELDAPFNDDQPVLLSMAVFVGQTRLIDNFLLERESEPPAA